MFSRGKKDREKKRRKQERREKVAICFRERGGENKDLGIPPPPPKERKLYWSFAMYTVCRGFKFKLGAKEGARGQGGDSCHMWGGGRVT